MLIFQYSLQKLEDLPSTLQKAIESIFMLAALFFTISFSLWGCLSYFSFEQPPTTYRTPLKPINYNMELGLAYLAKGDIQQAKSKLFEAEKQDSHSPYVKSAIAYFFQEIGEWKQAEQYHLKAMQADPKNSAIHNNYGCFLCHRHRYTQAEHHFLEATQDISYPNTANAYENLGLCALRHQKHQKAIFYLKKALRQNPHLEKADSALKTLYSARETPSPSIKP